MIPSGMMTTQATIMRPAVATSATTGQQTVTTTELASLVCHVESSGLRDAEWNTAHAQLSEAVIVTPYYPGVKVGHLVILANDSELITYKITKIEDDRMKHLRLRIFLDFAEEAVKT